MKLSPKKNKIWLSIPDTPLENIPSSAYLRCYLTTAIKNIFSRCGIILNTEEESQDILPNIEELFQSIQKNDYIYQASLSRQLAADLPPNLEQTSLKNEPKDWFIKTADYGDDCDRILQHRDGEFTQLLEDITHYHQIFPQNYDKIILIRPPIYTGYHIQLTAAMECLGYTKEQFQFMIVQPIKLYAFHQPTQKIHPIPDLATPELISAIGMDALRWHSLRVPLTEVAPINISTAGEPTAADSLYRLQTAHARCCALLQEAHQQGTIGLNTTQRDNWQIAPAPILLAEYTWDNSHAKKLASLVQAVPEILEQSAAEIAPHLVIRHLEAISDTCNKWSNSLVPTVQNCALLLATKQTIFEVMENIFSITAPEPIRAN